MAETAKHIRALNRGLGIIELLARSGRMSLAALRDDSALSNATLLRILATLQARGWVRRSLVDAKYELTYETGMFLKRTRHAHPLVEAAFPTMRDLEQSGLPYPSDLAVVQGPGVIEILETNRKKGPHAPVQAPYGAHPSMILSAHGKAIIAFSDAATRTVHLDAIRQTGSREERLWLDNGQFDLAILETICVGYGVRSEKYWVSGIEDVPETGAIAVPIFSQGQVVATISILWLDDQCSLADIINEGIPERLKDAARKIEANLAVDFHSDGQGVKR